MELFASPMACSLASHITALEAGLPVKVRFVKDKKTDDGGDYYGVSTHGYVPALRLDDGRILNENALGAAVPGRCQARVRDGAGVGGFERYQLIDTLNYLGTEVHKRIFYQVFSPADAGAASRRPKALIEPTLDHLAKRLTGRDTLVGDRFTVADAYLVTMLNWFAFLKVDLAKWPALQAYHQKYLQPALGRPGDGCRDGGAQAPPRGLDRSSRDAVHVLRPETCTCVSFASWRLRCCAATPAPRPITCGSSRTGREPGSISVNSTRTCARPRPACSTASSRCPRPRRSAPSASQPLKVEKTPSAFTVSGTIGAGDSIVAQQGMVSERKQGDKPAPHAGHARGALGARLRRARANS